MLFFFCKAVCCLGLPVLHISSTVFQHMLFSKSHDTDCGHLIKFQLAAITALLLFFFNVNWKFSYTWCFTELPCYISTCKS